MNQGLFCAQINEVEKILIRLELLKNRIQWPSYRSFQASFFKNKSYIDIWQLCIDNDLYDFLLNDNSLIQFRINCFEPLEISYTYYECPYVASIPYEKFIEGLDLSESDFRDELSSLRLYDYYLADLEKKPACTPIRYDYNTKQYVEGRHPASHFHLGFSNQIRIGTKKVLRPLSFLLFILRQCYPIEWIRFMDLADSETICRNIREHPSDIDTCFWKRRDSFEMILS